jgi:hypothetical protein
VAFFRLRPEAWNAESVVEIGAEVEHDANWEHDVHAKLLGHEGQHRVRGPLHAERSTSSYLEHLQIKTAHCACGMGFVVAAEVPVSPTLLARRPSDVRFEGTNMSILNLI